MRRSARVAPGFVIVALVCWCAVGPVAGDVPESQRAEVQHLLDYILEANCHMVRNGREHSATKAHAHVLKKYDYFRERIVSTEQFIELSATRSTMSGKPYRIRCGDAAQENASDWLLRELQRWRDAAGSD